MSTSTTYKLHGFAQSGNCFKVAFLLRTLNQAWEPVFVDYLQGVTKGEGWRGSMNEMGEIPVLEDGSRRLTQSGLMLTYLARKHGAYGGETEAERDEVLRWLLFDNHKFTSYFATYRFMKALSDEVPDPVVLNWLRGKMDAAFGVVDRHLSDRTFMVGNALTIADISLCGYLSFPVEESGYAIEGRYPHIHAWLSRMKAMPGWADPYDILPGGRPAPKR
ncbi:MAG: glutathione S-transferase family protein [Pseudomonadota bacterium]